MRARMVLPSVNDPNVLVLQGVKKAARGNYSCRVGNGIPTHDFEVESDPIFLDVKCKTIFSTKKSCSRERKRAVEDGERDEGSIFQYYA